MMQQQIDDAIINRCRDRWMGGSILYFKHKSWKNMQANCLVFPSPKNYNLEPIKDKIVLIPRNNNYHQHTTYQSLYKQGLSSSQQEDDFSIYLKHHSKTNTKQSSLLNSQRGNISTRRSVSSDRPQARLQGIQQSSQKVDPNQHIPCLFLKGRRPQLMLFFHANGQDLCSAFEFIYMVSVQTQFSVLAMEYRGYSIYGGQTDACSLEMDANRVVQFLMEKRITTDQIIVLGRSIGCAVALTLTNKYHVYCSILLSPFLSIKKIAQQLYGGCASALLKQSFDNQLNCIQITCPMLIIHGQDDTLVPYQHSLQIASRCRCYCRLKVIQNMTHTRFNFRVDFVRHLNQFITDIA